MSLPFIPLDMNKNTVAEAVAISGATPNSSSVVINTPVVMTQVVATASSPFLRLTDTNTSYTLNPADEYVCAVSPTYTSIYVPSAINKGGKKYVIMRAYDSNDSLTIYPLLPAELFDGQLDSLQLTSANTLIEIVSNGITWNTC
jgi:hypothetical protein